MKSTKLVWFVLPTLACSAHAEVNNTNKAVRLVSLSETLELALAHNLSLKIERLNPELAGANVRLAYAGGSLRVGQRNLVNIRDASYDPLFFAQASKTYNSYSNPLTYARRNSLQDSINDVNRQGFQNETATELATQAAAQNSLIRANATIRSHPANLTAINEDLRIGAITPQEAQTQIAEENARFQNAQMNFQDAQTILNNSTVRLANAQATDSQSLTKLARAQQMQEYLNTTPVGSQISGNGLIDPDTGFTVYQKEVTRDYGFTTGVRGALPLGSLYELKLDTVYQKSTLFDHDYSSTASITVGQPLLKNFLTDEARTLIQTSKKDLQIAEWALQFAINNTLTLAQSAYFDLIFAQENVKVQEMAVQLAEGFLREAELKVKAGILPQLDLRQAESVAAKARADFIAAQRDLAVAENALKRMITDDYAKWHDTVLQPSEKLVAVAEMYNLTESWGKALQLRPEYNQARLELEKQRILLRYARNQMLPSLDLVGSLASNGLDTRSYGRSLENVSDGNPSYFVGLILGYNIFNKDARARKKIAEVSKEKALITMKNLEQSILMEVDNNVKIAQSEYSRIEATRKARVYAETALEIQQKLLEGGKSTVFLVLEMQKNLTAARFDEINALTAYNKALAQFYFSEGTTLERNNIRLQVKE